MSIKENMLAVFQEVYDGGNLWISDGFIGVKNPNFQEDNGKDVHLVLSIEDIVTYLKEQK